MSYHDVVIVGAGHAGAQAAIFLRQLGFAGSIVLVGNEAHLPYERPPLSKEYFAGERSFERILIRPADFWKDRSVDIDLGREVTHVDPVAKSVRAGDRVYHYDKLIWATGGTPRNLTCDGALASNVHSIRRRDDIDAIMAKMDQIDHVTIIGGGYIGLEAAAVFRKFGKDVVLLEALDRVLSRVAGQALSEVYQAEHRAHGVDLRTEVRVDCIETRDDAAVAVILGNGDRISTDIVIVGVGIEPSIGPLASASVAVNNGVEVDRFCQTSLPDVYAIGDCASPLPQIR